MKVRLILTEEMLGTKAANPDVFAAFIASKHPSGTPQKDELDKAENREENGTTIFHKDSDGYPILWDYQLKGFFKDAGNMTNRMDKKMRNGLEKLTAYKTKIDGLVFIVQREVKIHLPTGTGIGVCERPLRAETAQGPRVSVCRSETVPVGSVLEFDIKILSTDLEPYVEFWLGYGAMRGLGQWRNSGKGTFTYEELDDDGEVIEKKKAKKTKSKTS